MATLRELLGENYRDGMTLDEVDTLISGMKLADLKTGNYVSVDKANGYEKRAKEAEKRLAEKLTDEEKAKAQLEERERYYADLERKLSISNYEKSLSFLGDANLISEVATLYAEGKIVEANNKISEHKVKSDNALTKKIKEEQMQTNPQANAQSGSPTKTKAEIMAIKDAQQRQMEIAKNINLFTK